MKLADHEEYQAAEKRLRERDDEDYLVISADGSVAVEQPEPWMCAEVSVFVQQWEEPMQLSPENTRLLAWELLVAADLAAQATRSGSTPTAQEGHHAE